MIAVDTKAINLETINLLQGLPQSDMKKIAQISEIQTVPKNTYIYHIGDSCDTVFFLKQGRIKIGTVSKEGKEIIKAILHPEEIFGELGITGETARRDFAKSMNQEVKFYKVKVADLLSLMQNSPNLSIKLITQIGDRLKKTERKLESLIFNDARTRIIDFLRDSAKRRGIKVGYEILLKHFLTHQEIANITATSRQTVTTVLNDLKKSDLIYTYRKNILIRDLDKLS